MIPASVTLNAQDSSQDFETHPSLTYRLDFENNRIIGKVDDRESVAQAVTKALSTEKYAHEVYDWYYGNEILTLIGKPLEYVKVEAPRIILEALMVDDRITDVTEFIFTRVDIESVEITFVIHSVFGDMDYSLEVSI